MLSALPGMCYQQGLQFLELSPTAETRAQPCFAPHGVPWEASSCSAPDNRVTTGHVLMAVFGVPEQWRSVTRWFRCLQSQEYTGFPAGLVTSTGRLRWRNILTQCGHRTHSWAVFQQHVSSCHTSHPYMSLPYGQPHSQRQGNSLGQVEAEFCGVKATNYLWNDIISTPVNSAVWCWLQ